MSYFDDASLVMIPSGYKDQKVYSIKPLDGAGDLTFSRASSATRVASNGLIEKVRTNLLLQSNTFSTTWANDNTTETSGQAGYDGTNNAWLISKSASGGSIYQTGLSSSSLQTFSLYAKQGTSTWISMTILGGSNPRTSFDLVNGVVGTLLGGAISAKIESVGNGWYRCSVVASVSGSGVYIYPSEGDGVTTATSGTLIIQNAQLEASDIATDYIPTTTAAVSVGPVSGLPRLDYLGSTCPRLLLEPQRTSNVQFSEAFDNAYWTKTSVTLTSTLGGPIDQSKYFTITCDGTTGRFKGVGKTFINASANTYTLSVFAKAGTSSAFVVSSRATLTADDVRAIFNLSNGTITNTNGGTAAIVPYGDGWYRCSFTVVNAGTFTNESSIFFGHPFGAADGATVLATGAMSEIGAYPSSYIPTLSTSVTRVADAASKTGISSLIGQTEGTLFLDFTVDTISGQTNDPVLCYMKGGGTGERYVQLYDEGNLSYVEFNGATIASITKSGLTVGRHKCAIGYAPNNMTFYVDGVQVGTDTSGTPSGFSEFGFQYYNSVYYGQQKINQALLFKTRLSNSDLATLTTL
jgi:hypothetical protein